MKNWNLTNFLVALFFGILIWYFSPEFVGEVEPWDSESSYFFLSLFLVGAISSIPKPHSAVSVHAGVVLGQFAFVVLALESGPLLFAGFVSLLAFSTLAFLGAMMAEDVILFINSKRNRS